MDKHRAAEPTGTWACVSDDPYGPHRYYNLTTNETVDVTEDELTEFEAKVPQASATWAEDFYKWLDHLAETRPEPAPIPHAIEGPGGTWGGMPSNTKGVCQFQCEETGQIVSVSEKEYSDFESRFPPHSATRVFNLHNWLMSRAEGGSLSQ